MMAMIVGTVDLGQVTRRVLGLGVLVCAVALSGCAGRAPQLIQVVKAEDNQLSCDQIIAEVRTNNERISQLAEEEGWKVAQNVAAGVAGLVVPVLWFGLDFQDAAGKEAKALSQRNGYLAEIAGKRGCAGIGPATSVGAPPRA